MLRRESDLGTRALWWDEREAGILETNAGSVPAFEPAPLRVPQGLSDMLPLLSTANEGLGRGVDPNITDDDDGSAHGQLEASREAVGHFPVRKRVLWLSA